MSCPYFRTGRRTPRPASYGTCCTIPPLLFLIQAAGRGDDLWNGLLVPWIRIRPRTFNPIQRVPDPLPQFLALLVIAPQSVSVGFPEQSGIS